MSFFDLGRVIIPGKFKALNTIYLRTCKSTFKARIVAEKRKLRDRAVSYICYSNYLVLSIDFLSPSELKFGSVEKESEDYRKFNKFQST